MIPRIGHGYDVHKLEKDIPLFLCGIKIEHTHGLTAHSDGDVAIHALCDALLGAMALGDIGKHFPDTSADFKGIDSKLLLAEVVKMITTKGNAVGNVIGNVDLTIAAQSPKLAPHILPMRECLANILGIPLDRVSVKATTTERLGFVGREEGIEASAVVIVFTPN